MTKKLASLISIMGKKPHVVVVPYPAQGHVAPLMKLAYKLADQGIRVTFVNTESIHSKIISSIPDEKLLEQHSLISLISIPEELELNNNDGKDGFEVLESMSSYLPNHLQNLIENINGLENDDGQLITHVIADISVGWALQVAKKMGIERSAFVPYGLGNLALVLHFPKLIEAGIIDVQGIPIKDELICLSKEIPAWKTNELAWSYTGDSELQKFIFRHFIRQTVENVKISNFILVNSANELEPSAYDLIPNNVLPIGPLFTDDQLGPFAGNFWPEDSTCLTWLDKKPAKSVIYVAFGSVVEYNQQQFNELANGLEILGQPFLWVVRSNCINGEFPEGFLERVANFGKMVQWAPQEKVLAHPSIACFVSHCGWNSTMEGLIMGVPFICWPYCVDQLHNKHFICETWKVGLGLIPNEDGIITRDEIKIKTQKLLYDKDIKANSSKFKEMARKSIGEGGSSFKNFISFVQQINK